MWFQRLGRAAAGQIEAKCDSFCVLVYCVEGVAQVHEECVAAPPEAVLDI